MFNGTDGSRSMLSEISKLFDPMGWLSPISIVAKSLRQKLWLKSAEMRFFQLMITIQKSRAADESHSSSVRHFSQF